jgi:NADH:ubiquinone oxidoreductase subunit 5 (subunit L)/multisubunit Na+/H+ antiporter MnhA subunit
MLTAVYMLIPIFRAYFPNTEFNVNSVKGAKDPTWLMCLPFIVFVIFMISMCLDAPWLMGYFDGIANLM